MGSRVEDLLKCTTTYPIFLTNRIFLHFCLWFLSKSNRYITKENACLLAPAEIFSRYGVF